MNGPVCSPCGISANVLTCLKKYGRPPKKLAYSMSTFHSGVCVCCQEAKPVTEQRDFFYPDFDLLREAMKEIKVSAPGSVECSGCGSAIAPDTCGCGTDHDSESMGHAFNPMGCGCLRNT